MHNSKINLTEKRREQLRKEIRRKTRIIAWLLPRFHKGISKPKDYEKLIGRTDNNEI